MKRKRQEMRRRQLDAQLVPLRSMLPVVAPAGGWVHAIREALGMSLETFGKRLSVTRTTALQIERAEVSESITLKRLRAAANALECDLVVSFVPRQSLETTIWERAVSLARSDLARIQHSMVLESQAVYDGALADMVSDAAKDIIERNDARLWAL